MYFIFLKRVMTDCFEYVRFYSDGSMYRPPHMRPYTPRLRISPTRGRDNYSMQGRPAPYGGFIPYSSNRRSMFGQPQSPSYRSPMSPPPSLMASMGFQKRKKSVSEHDPYSPVHDDAFDTRNGVAVDSNREGRLNSASSEKITLIKETHSPPSLINPAEIRDDVTHSDVSEESEDDDDDEYNQEYIEEQIDRIDTEIAKQERLITTFREKATAVADAKAAKELAEKDLDENGESKPVIEPKIILPDLILEDVRAKIISHSTQEPKSTETVIEKILKENHELARMYSRRTFDRDVLLAFNTEFAVRVVKEPSEFECYEENIKKNTFVRPYIAWFISQSIQQKEALESDLREEYESLHASWLRKIQKLEKAKAKKNAQGANSAAEPTAAIQPAWTGEHASITGRATRRSGIRSDVVRTEAEWQNALVMLGIGEDKDAHILSRCAKDPPMIIDPKEREQASIRSTNHLVHDPVQELADFNGALDLRWSEEERDIFRLKLVQYGKDFNRISSFLPQKNVQDCVQYFYRKKISMRFKQLIRQSNSSGRGRRKKDKPLPQVTPNFFKTFLLRPDEDVVYHSREWFHEHQRRNEAEKAEVPHVAPSTNNGSALAKTSTSKAKKRKTTTGEASDGFPIVSGMNAHTEKSRIPSPSTPDESWRDNIAAAGTAADDSWTEYEKNRALRAFEFVGRDFEAVAEVLRTKTAEQCKVFYNNHRRKARESKAPAADSSIAGPAAGPKRKKEQKKKAAGGKRKRVSDVSRTEGDDEHVVVEDENQHYDEENADEIDVEGAGTDERLPSSSKGKQKQQRFDGAATEKQPKSRKPVDEANVTLRDELGNIQSRKTISYWSVSEKNNFPLALARFGRNWEQISRFIGTKSVIQVRNYFQNFAAKQGFMEILERNGHSLEDGDAPVAAEARFDRAGDAEQEEMHIDDSAGDFMNAVPETTPDMQRGWVHNHSEPPISMMPFRSPPPVQRSRSEDYEQTSPTRSVHVSYPQGHYPMPAGAPLVYGPYGPVYAPMYHGHEMPYGYPPRPHPEYAIHYNAMHERQYYDYVRAQQMYSGMPPHMHPYGVAQILSSSKPPYLHHVPLGNESVHHASGNTNSEGYPEQANTIIPSKDNSDVLDKSLEPNDGLPETRLHVDEHPERLDNANNQTFTPFTGEDSESPLGSLKIKLRRTSLPPLAPENQQKEEDSKSNLPEKGDGNSISDDTEIVVVDDEANSGLQQVHFSPSNDNPYGVLEPQVSSDAMDLDGSFNDTNHV